MKRRCGAALAAALWLGGCATQPTQAPVSPRAAPELTATPFFAQTRYQCGPAALATVLAASGAPVPPETLGHEVYLPARQGSLQLELVAAARRHGRVPYVLAPQAEAIFAEVAAGRPVLLLQNLGLSWIPVWHYAVVIGLESGSDLVVLRSGTEPRRRMRYRDFVDTWERGGRWALVTVRPDELPATAAMLPWLQSVAAFEQLGQAPLALQAEEAASRRWPESALVWQVLGNARYAAGDRRAARSAYREAVQRAPDAAGYNNLAQTELELGCVDAARAALTQAQALPSSPAVTSALAETAAAVAATPSARCQP